MAKLTHEKTRKKFEGFISSSPYERAIRRWPNDSANYAWPGEYCDVYTQLAWESWCAAFEAMVHAILNDEF